MRGLWVKSGGNHFTIRALIDGTILGSPCITATPKVTARFKKRAWRLAMKALFVATALLAAALTATGASIAAAAPCLIVTLTGAQGGPQSFNGLAGAGTLVRFGDDANGCSAVRLQFDAG